MPCIAYRTVGNLKILQGDNNMESNNTSSNEYVLCLDCKHGQGHFVAPDQEFACPRWGKYSKMKNVGICKFYANDGCDYGNTRNQ